MKFIEYEQIDLFEKNKKTKTNIKKSLKTTFTSNMKLPIHRWYRFSAGFSAEWAKKIISENITDDSQVVLDPFAGSGTTMLASDTIGVSSIGFEAQPFIWKMANSKTNWDINPVLFWEYANTILTTAQNNLKDEQLEEYPQIIFKSFSEENILKLQSLVHSTKSLSSEKKIDQKIVNLLIFTISAILRNTAHVGTAQWQYILPNKKSKGNEPFNEYLKKALQIYNDINLYKKADIKKKSQIFFGSSKNMDKLANNSVDFVLTSPPYANNYDYADTTRLEMSFYHEITGWGDLQDKVRKDLVHSSTQSITKLRSKTYELIDDPLLKSIHEDLYNKCKTLENEKNNHGGKKNYYTMIAAYFYDIAQILKELRRVCKPGSRMCWVIGDSAPYGIYIPVDEWIGKIAVNVGFKSYSFIKERDRNVKWKNRKHTVPLKEGYLWIEG